MKLFIPHLLHLNPLTTDDKCIRHGTLVACYQLAQCILKIGFALVKKVGYGELGGFQHRVACKWQLPWLAVENPWLAPAGSFLAQTSIDKARLLCLFGGTISGTVDSFQSGDAFTCQKALIIVSSIMSWHDRGHEP